MKRLIATKSTTGFGNVAQKWLDSYNRKLEPLVSNVENRLEKIYMSARLLKNLEKSQLI
jgi:hypothetical protein